MPLSANAPLGLLTSGGAREMKIQAFEQTLREQTSYLQKLTVN